MILPGKHRILLLNEASLVLLLAITLPFVCLFGLLFARIGHASVDLLCLDFASGSVGLEARASPLRCLPAVLLSRGKEGCVATMGSLCGERLL